MKKREVPFTIREQGAPVVSTAWTRYETKNCICIEVDLQSKYCDLLATTGQGVLIGANERTLKLDPTKPRDQDTWIEFALPTGTWRFFSGGCSRYTLSCVFLKEKP